jgi:hypothetical protein
LANRAQIYALPDDQRNAAIIDRSNTIVSNLGVLYPVNIVDMLNQALATTRLLEIFLSEVGHSAFTF